ncbi:hypothetical protein B7486_16495 [cyanobacterium TDX16]|nr:hypothetical protein B7486_16495 [cyanobacterium TDX16]
MLRNVNQWSGVLAMIAVACLVAFGSAGDRIVSAAPGQIAPAGDTGTAIAIGGCNRCAWNYRVVTVPGPIPNGMDVELFPPGTSGAILNCNFLMTNSWRVYSENLEPGGTGFVRLNFEISELPENGIRFVNGLTLRWTGGTQGLAELWFLYRLD